MKTFAFINPALPDAAVPRTSSRRMARLPAAPSAVQQLAKGQTLARRDPLGLRVTCTAGSLWLASDGDPRDVVLQAGESHVVDRATPLTVHALEAAAVIFA